mgnify:CR=1 FL=1
MFHITIGIDPVIAHLGPLALRWYSLAILMAIVIAVVVTKREFQRKGLPLDRYDSLVLWTVAGGILGARLFHVLDRPGWYLANPQQILAFDQGGLAIYGAVAGGFLTVAVLSRYYEIPFLPMIDAIAPGLLLAQAFGRFGCIVNGDAWGAPTSSPFAFVYTNPNAFLPHDLLGVPTHPYPVYDMALNLLVFAVIWRLRSHHLPAGVLFATFVAIYAPGRLLISFVRQERIWFWGLQEAQVIALVAGVVAIVTIGWLLARRRHVVPATAA